MARLDKTLIDYLIIAISPALIMTLVGSLVFFLLEVFYKGNFGDRMHCIFALFVFAAVLVARISIDEGRERAALFAVPLAIVTLLAINKFVQFQGVLVPLSFFINCGLIGLIWWSANQLTWDCTMIDEDTEDSGEGLLEAVGLDQPGKAVLQKEIAPAAKEPVAAAMPGKKPLNWWQRFIERRRRPHTPGVWVVYFSLTALPLFGIGQFIIPAAMQSDRRYAFQLLFVYTASGLALLLATSFLSLRRYLRQRRQEMPIPIVNLWLGIGGLLIVGAMLLAMLLPRPNAEYDLSDLAFRIGSPDQNSSQYSVGSEGVEENQPDAQSEKRDGEQSDATTEEQSDKTQSDEHGKEEKSQAQDQSQSEQKSPSDKSDEAESDKSKTTPEKKKSQKPSKPLGGSSAKKEPSDNNQTKQPNGGQKSNPSPLRPSIPRLSSPVGIAWLLTVFKWIFYGVLAIAVIYATWLNREAFWKAFCDFVRFFADFWHNLFGSAGRRAKAAAEAANAQKTLPRFANFTDPFAAGLAHRYPPAELVRYTFAALEAWGRDRGCPRPPDQTPHEFVRCLVGNASALGDDAARLADLYCQVAYASFTLPAASVEQLSQLWRIMRSEGCPSSTP